MIDMEAFGKVGSYYIEPHRHYHSLEHIYLGLANLYMFFADSGCDLITVGYAWWLHDAIYVPGAPDNEIKSAELAKSMGMSSEVQDLILATIYPNPKRNVSLNEAVINDLDLFGFAMLPHMYDHHTEQIRKEFPNVSDADFVAGRKKFLTKLVEQQNPLYKTELGNLVLNQQAMANIQRDINAS